MISMPHRSPRTFASMESLSSIGSNSLEWSGEMRKMSKQMPTVASILTLVIVIMCTTICVTALVLTLRVTQRRGVRSVSEPQHMTKSGLEQAIINYAQTEDFNSIKVNRQVRKPKLARLLSRPENMLSKASGTGYGINDPALVVSEDFSDCGYHFAMTLLGASSNQNYPTKLLNRFSHALTSILSQLNATGLESGAVCIHLITDSGIQGYVREAIGKVHQDLALKNNLDHRNSHSIKNEYPQDISRPLTRYFFIDAAVIEARLEYILPSLQAHFSHKTGNYAKPLFFYSLVLHRVLTKQVADRLILLDVDIEVHGNLLELYEEFGRFKENEVMAMAYDQQPVYRHILAEYRRQNPNTTFGSPASGNGFPGFNSGVMLLHLRKMRESKVYNSLLNTVVIEHMCEKYHFRGHLGDQDFYTVAALDHRTLFHTLPCGWNRQLCQWWRWHGYSKNFEEYHRCEGSEAKLYHGNCNTALPGMASNVELSNRH